MTSPIIGLLVLALLSTGCSQRTQNSLLAEEVPQDTLYTYTGDTWNYVDGVYLREDRIRGSFTLSHGFVPQQAVGAQDVSRYVVSWTWTDGHQTLTEANSTGRFQVGFNLDGSPITPTHASFPNANHSSWWFVEIIANDDSGEIVTQERENDYLVRARIGDSFAQILNFWGNDDGYPGGPGTWTVGKVASQPTT